MSDRGIRKADGEVQKTGDRTTPSYYPVIKQSQTGDFSIERSLRKSSHDELFQVAKNKPNLVAKKITPENLAKRENRPNITWQTLDNSLDLKTNNNHPTFVEAHEFARVKNKELHLADKGHTGSIFRNGTSSSSKEGTVSDGYFKTSWDDDKMGIIQKLMGRIKTKEDKESSPEKVTTELLKLAINKVVKYDGDYPKKNPELYTSSGLNLSDEIEREFAFKTSQASRDKWKMSVVALEGRFNDQDSEAEEGVPLDKQSVIKRKVTRTKVDKKLHGHDRNLSPIRSGSPYSDFNFELNFNELDLATKKTGKSRYQAIADTFAKPTPAIHPSAELKSKLAKETPEQKEERKKNVRFETSKALSPIAPNFPPTISQKKHIEIPQMGKLSKNLDADFAQNIIDFNQDSEVFTHNDLIGCYNDASESSAKKLGEKHQGKLERYLTDDERFICLWMECSGNAGLSFNVNREEGFSEIKKGAKLLAICPIQSISTDHKNYKDTIKDFINSHKNKGVKIIFSIHGGNHYKTLAINPQTNKYRYIDSMHDSEDGVIENDALKASVNELGYARFGYSYEKQQYSEDMHKESGGVISHNNECAFHNVYTTIRIAQSQDIGSYLGDMKRYKMTMLGREEETLTPEFARDYIRPFYEEVFENLRKFIKNEKQVPNSSVLLESSKSLTGKTAGKSSTTNVR